MSYLIEILSDSPWGVWRLNDIAGPTLADSSGNGRSATITGTDPTYNQPSLIPSEPFDKSVNWAQTNTGAVVGTAPSFPSYTATVIYKPSGLGSPGDINYLISHEENFGQDIFILRTDGTSVAWYVRNDSGTYHSVIASAVGGGPLAIGETYWFAGVFTGTILELHGAKKDTGTGKFGNRELLGATAFSGTRKTTTPSLRIAHAAWSNSYSAHGDIDTVAYFGTALSYSRLSTHLGAINTSSFIGWGIPVR